MSTNSPAQPSPQDSASQPRTLAERVAATRPTRWARFALVSIVFLAWVAWMGSWWLAIFELLLFDIYITGYIPLTWWKRSKSGAVRGVMGWVDAIVYALVLVYFIFAFVGQNYVIPSSSLEKTLLTGDYLWVNKLTYGPRVPMTPVHFPLVHNTLPILGCKSYLDSPSNPYRRLKGLRSVEAGDIVVFNFPAGDTVATLWEDSPMYYDLLVQQYGWREVNTNKAKFGSVIYRPVDRRVNFVKRVVGLPGQRLKIKGDTIYIDGNPQAQPANAQLNYVLATSAPLTEDITKELDIAEADCQFISRTPQAQALITALEIPDNAYVYAVPLTQGMLTALRDKGILISATKQSDIWLQAQGQMFPGELAADWTLSDWGGTAGVLIPRKGLTVEITPDTWQLYRRCIRNYEGHPDASFADGVFTIDGHPAKTYTFGMDYYFMMGDNRHNSQDSRFWGFVPEDHVVGTPAFVLASFDKDRPLFSGGIRWSRFFSDANPDK